ncbi:hypothetical protein MASR1M46_13850 [Bacteroidales bacterium]
MQNFPSLLPAQYHPIINNNLNVSPLDMNLSGKSGIGLGFNIGILYSPTDRLSIGLSYRSKVMMKLEGGSAAISYGSPELQTLFGMLSQSPNFPAAIKGAIALNGAEFDAEFQYLLIQIWVLHGKLLTRCYCQQSCSMWDGRLMILYQ